jgi:hypothetical protein
MIRLFFSATPVRRSASNLPASDFGDRPAADVLCSRPDGVQTALNAAVDRAKPPTVNCDRTPSPAVVPFVPKLNEVGDIPANDAWKAQMIGLYQAEVTIRRGEHACWNALRTGGAIQ